jgi:microcystin-dependent protein
MAQSWHIIDATDLLSESQPELNQNFDSLKSCFAGTIFPTTNQTVGMLCFRTDQNRLYQLKSTAPDVWVLLVDILDDFWRPTAAATAGTNTYTVTFDPPIAGYVVDRLYLVRFTLGSTSATCTVNIDGKGAKNIKRIGNKNLKIGDIPANHLGLLHYDGTQMILLNAAESEESVAVVASGTNTYSASLDPVPAGYVTNKLYFVLFTNANTGAGPSINLNSFGARTIKHQGGATVAIGDIPAGWKAVLFYDGTDMILMNPAFPVRASSTDTTPGRLFDKITVAGLVTKALTGTGANEAVQLSVSANESVPVGAIFFMPGTTAPAGSIKANGALLNRVDFPALWAYAQVSGNLVSDATWLAGAYGSFSTGNGTTTFRVPDTRGYHVRSWDDARGVDTSRSIGSSQADDNKIHAHSITDQIHAHQELGSFADPNTTNPDLFVVYGANSNGNGNFFPNGRSDDFGNVGTSNTTANSGTGITGTNNSAGASETRVKNIALLGCIKT